MSTKQITYFLYAIAGLGLVVLANSQFAKATIEFLKLARRHVDIPLHTEMIVFMIIVNLFLFVTLIILFMTLRVRWQRSKRKTIIQFMLFGAVFIDTVYWLAAFTAIDCIECSGGHLSFLLFWVNVAWLN